MKNPVSRTAYYTLGLRAWDATLPTPACGDSYAKLFMNEEAQKVWEEFRNFEIPNSSNASRHAIIDKQLQDALAAAPTALVVIIGAGFDTRAFRLKGGNWVEVDEAAIISLKESVLPSPKAPNSLRRISIDFSSELLTEKINSLSTEDVTHVIIEGVLMYLSQSSRETLVKDLKKLFPNHIVYCDLMRRSFFEKYSSKLHEKIVALGATFTELKEHPEELFLQKGYSAISSTSIPLYASEYGNVKVPAFVIRYFLKTLKNGYCIWRFRTGR
jgi:methyltransferase (TIGR00027 family)